jgi:hypothetical protein
VNGRIGDRKKRVASDGDVPTEKWLVAYQNPASKRHPDGSFFIRQFYASGFYEAYDKVMTYAENMNLEVVWFHEKRSCEQFINSDFPELESCCTYCNKKFNHIESVPCRHEGCDAEFCSRECFDDHLALRHRVQDKPK